MITPLNSSSFLDIKAITYDHGCILVQAAFFIVTSNHFVFCSGLMLCHKTTIDHEPSPVFSNANLIHSSPNPHEFHNLIISLVKFWLTFSSSYMHEWHPIHQCVMTSSTQYNIIDFLMQLMPTHNHHCTAGCPIHLIVLYTSSGEHKHFTYPILLLGGYLIEAIQVNLLVHLQYSSVFQTAGFHSPFQSSCMGDSENLVRFSKLFPIASIWVLLGIRLRSPNTEEPK